MPPQVEISVGPGKDDVTTAARVFKTKIPSFGKISVIASMFLFSLLIVDRGFDRQRFARRLQRENACLPGDQVTAVWAGNGKPYPATIAENADASSWEDQKLLGASAIVNHQSFV